MQDILSDISNVMGEKFNHEYVETILNKLETIGYKAKEEDSFLICFSIQKVENDIKNTCNISEIPEQLFNVAIDRICGEFLFTKKQTGQLIEEEQKDIINCIKMGDMSIELKTDASPAQKFDSLIADLTRVNEVDYICCRRINW